ncbi:heavy metal-associated isoprenylated plant protein 47-like [Carica papaya]|uniref:heavy metal-associated isoprenylated plant protein 47-like n=1 Tax=Carica papaya TaxID=3649 RepID=UPI000B8D167E|nr:heavy metal-associated isoprenylated plant protein 47-like [Carica papaya]
MKQKIVIKVEVKCDKCRIKALTVAADSDGVTSMGFEGEGKDRLVVIGEGVDSVKLTERLRKKNVYATIETVEEVKPPKPEEKKEEKPLPAPPPSPPPPPPPCQPQFQLCEVVYDDPYASNPRCTIM